MRIKTPDIYKCDLCGTRLRDNPLLPLGEGKKAFSFKRPGGGRRLEVTARAEDGDVHLCADCLSWVQAAPPICGAGYECDGGPSCASDHK
jgi:hypothetical protein